VIVKNQIPRPLNLSFFKRILVNSTLKAFTNSRIVLNYSVIMAKKKDKLSCDEFTQIVKNAPLIAIDLIVKNERCEILLGLRTNEPAANFWFVLGGRILKDELITNAFERIAKNELGIKINYADAEFVGVYEHLYPNNFTKNDDFGTHYVVLAHKIAVEQSTLELSKEQHSYYRWLKPGDLVKEQGVHDNTKAYFPGY